MFVRIIKYSTFNKGGFSVRAISLRNLKLIMVLASVLSASVAVAKEPEHVTVQHILIAFQGSIPGKNITRTKVDAEKLANEVMKKAKDAVKKAKNKTDADVLIELVKAYTDDSPPGVYKMSNNNISSNPGEFPRNGMVPAFGDVGFKLKVGDIGLAKFDSKKSPFGYHIIRRLE